MKKLILLLSACAALVACNDDKNPGDALAQYLDIYAALAANQHTAMDPFLVAFRYHLYQEAGETSAAKSQYLPEATIEKNADDQRVTLTFKAADVPPTGDLSREGVLTIHTFGTSLLDEGAVWQITATNEGSGYDLTDWNMINATLYVESGDEYLISHLGAGHWRVQTEAIYLRSHFLGTAWNWGVDVIATLLDGRMTIGAGSAPSAGGGMGVDTEVSARYRYEILDPLVYDPDCGLLVKSAGKERIVRTDRKDYKGLDSLVLDRGQSTGSCMPGFSFSVRAETDESWTTHQYGPNGEWLY